MKTVLTTDWAPYIERTARRIGIVVALVWTLYSMAADRLQQLTAWVKTHHIHGLSRLGLPGGAVDEVAPARVIVQRQAAVATPANIAPPARVIHISDPMACAVRLVRDGKSQRLAASICGVSRTSLQRALKG